MIPMTEKEWSAEVVKQARRFGWARYHTYRSTRSEWGWPDEALCRPPRLILAELKTDAGVLSPPQRRWRELLEACTQVEYHLWRPADLTAMMRALLPEGVRVHDDH